MKCSKVSVKCRKQVSSDLRQKQILEDSGDFRVPLIAPEYCLFSTKGCEIFPENCFLESVGKPMGLEIWA